MKRAAHFGSFHFISEGICDPSVQPNRLVCLDRTHVAICNGNSLHVVNIAHSPREDIDDDVDDGNVIRSNAYSPGHSRMIQLSSKNPLQSVCKVASTTSFACVDASGGVSIVSSRPTDGCDLSEYEFNAQQASPLHGTYSTGWAGICAGDGVLATAHYLSKEISWIDMNTLQTTRSSVSTGNPTCIASYVSSNETSGAGGIVMTGDMSGAVSIWDVRQGAKGGCVHREVVCSGRNDRLWSILPIACGQGFQVVAAGSDRVVRVLDSKTWRSRVKWRAPNKYDIVKLLPGPCPAESSSVSLYLTGRDNEVLRVNVPTQMTQQQRVAATKGTSLESFPHKKRRVEQANEVERGVELGSTAKNASAPPRPLHHTELPSASKLRMSHHRGVRAEFFWTGMDVCRDGRNGELTHGCDRLVGLCGRGKIYVVDNAHLMTAAEVVDGS